MKTRNTRSARRARLRPLGNLTCLVFGSLLALGTTTVAADAFAFCRSTGTSPEADGCTVTADNCCTVGKPFFWRNACVGYNLQKDGTTQVAFEDVERIVGAAFSAWTQISCPSADGVSPRVGIDARYLGPVDCKVVGHQSDGPNQHVIVFRNQWPPPGQKPENKSDTSFVLAYTKVQYRPETGEILGADMEINATKTIAIDNDEVPDVNTYDLQSVLTHEAGHFFGLAHSADDNATMYAGYNNLGRTPSLMRRPALDDVAGLCAVYPPNGTRATADDPALPSSPCDPTPRGGLSSMCGTETGSGCCRSAAVREQSPAGWITFLIATGALAIRRRRANIG